MMVLHKLRRIFERMMLRKILGLKMKEEELEERA